MKYFKIGAMALLLTGFTVGCSKSSDENSNSKMSKTTEKMSGYWTTDMASFSASSSSSHIDHIGRSEVSYSFIKIEKNGSAEIQIMTISDKTNNDSKNERVIQFGNLMPTNENEAKIILNQEVIDEAKKSGASDEDLENWKNNPCVLKLIEENKMEMLCTGIKDVTEPFRYLRVTDTDAEKTKTEIQSNFAKIESEKTTLASVLAGKQFILTETKYLIVDKDNKKTEFTSANENPIDETGEGDKLSINPNRITFASDFSSAKINEKRDLSVELFLPKDKTNIGLTLLFERRKNVFVYVLSGKIMMTKDGFDVVSDYSVDGSRYMSTKVFKRAE